MKTLMDDLATSHSNSNSWEVGAELNILIEDLDAFIQVAKHALGNGKGETHN